MHTKGHVSRVFLSPGEVQVATRVEADSGNVDGVVSVVEALQSVLDGSRFRRHVPREVPLVT